MGALHVIGHDFQLGLGIHPGPIRKQQAAAQLGGIGALRQPGHFHSPIEHTATLAIGQHLVQLVQLAVGPIKTHGAVGIGNLTAVAHLQAPQPGAGGPLALHYPGFKARQTPTAHGTAQRQFTGGLLQHRPMGQQTGLRFP